MKNDNYGNYWIKFVYQLIQKWLDIFTNMENVQGIGWLNPGLQFIILLAIQETRQRATEIIDKRRLNSLTAYPRSLLIQN